jgi:hypothetical protein
MRSLALALAEHLQGKALSRLQQATASEAMLCELAQTLADEGDAEMAALHDRHSPQTLAQKSRPRPDAGEALRWAAAGRGKDAAEAHARRHGPLRRPTKSRRAARPRRQRKARQKPAAQQAEAQALAVDAETQLRTLFRQLASALHPDREPDPAERLRKTALMSEANTAYARKDLVTLMQIQLRAELADPAAVSRLATTGWPR